MVVYRSFYEAIKELPEHARLEVYEAIFELGLNYKEVKLSGISKSFFDIIKPKIESNNKKAEAGIKSGKLGAKHGKKGGRPPVNKPPKKPTVKPSKKPQETSNQKQLSMIDSEELAVDKTNIDYTKWTVDDFKKDITKNQANYSNELLTEFFLNWSEKGTGGKMKFQLQKTWETKLRLKKWELLNYSKIETKKISNNNYNNSTVKNLELWNK